MRVARPVTLSPEQRRDLEQHSRARSLSARLVERARIVLRAAEGLQDQQIAEELSITPEKAARWRNRFLDGGLPALQKDAPRAGRPTIGLSLLAFLWLHLEVGGENVPALCNQPSKIVPVTFDS